MGGTRGRSRVQEQARWWRRGQATVEFAIVAAAFISLIVACAALASLHQDGSMQRHALVAASHHVEGGDVGAWDDVLAY